MIVAKCNFEIPYVFTMVTYLRFTQLYNIKEAGRGRLSNISVMKFKALVRMLRRI